MLGKLSNLCNDCWVGEFDFKVKFKAVNLHVCAIDGELDSFVERYIAYGIGKLLELFRGLLVLGEIQVES